MEIRPDYKDFYDKNRKLLRNRKSYIYIENSTRRIFIENNAQYNRIIHELVLCAIPFIFFLPRLLFQFIPLPTLYVIVVCIVYILIKKSFRNRYLRVRFIEVNKYEDADVSKVKYIEYFLYTISLIGLLFFSLAILGFI